MEDSELLNRRTFLRSVSQLGIVTLTGASVLSVTGCTRERTSKDLELGDVASCDGTVKLTTEEQAQRKDLEYVETSPNGDKQDCSNCIRFIAPDGNAQCGACGVISGPINPNGYCNDWEPKDL